MDNESPQVCRLCLVEQEDLVYIFHPKDYRGFRLWEIIEELLQLEVSKQDGLPGTICEECFAKVKEFKEFKTTCIRAKIFLQTKIANMGFMSSSPERPAREARLMINQLDVLKLNTFEPEHSAFLQSGESTGGVHFSTMEDQVGDVGLIGRKYMEKIGTKEEADSTESGSTESTLSEGQAYNHTNLAKDESARIDVYNVTSDPLDLIGVKADADVGKSFLEEETQYPGNFSDSESMDANISNVVCLPVEMGDMMDDCCISGENPKACGKMSDVREGRNKITLKKITKPSCFSQRQNSRNNFAMTSEIQQNQMKKKRSAKCKRRLKSWKSDISIFKEYDLRHLASREKSSSNCIEYVCDYCGLKYTHTKKLLAHIRGHASNNKLPMCITSGEMSFIPSKLNTARNQGSAPFKCEKCGKEFESKSKLSSHIIKNCGVKPFKYETYGKKFTHKSHLREHEMLHSGLKPFKCEACGKEFALKSRLMRHAIIQSGLRPFKCEICGKGFSRKDNLREHEIMHMDCRQFKCESCGKGFSQKDDLRKHAIIQHSGLRPFKCETCGKEFTKKGILREHTIVHTGLRPFKCETCWMDFSRKGQLMRHAIIHMGLRPFKCETCGKEFTRKDHLKEHAIIHSGLRPFKCETCGKEFTRKDHLKEHAIIHSGLRPFKCETCGKEFIHRVSLRRHAIIHSSLRPIKCETRGKEFTLKCSFRRHAFIQSVLRP